MEQQSTAYLGKSDSPRFQLWQIPHDRLRGLAAEPVNFEVKRNTVMRSYSLMEEEGILENKRRIGFFVAAGAKRSLLKIQKQTFFNQDLPELLHKVEVLQLNSEDLALLIKSNDHENQ